MVSHPEGINMEDLKIGKGSISIWALIGCAGGILALVSMFLAIADYEGMSLTGTELLKQKADGVEIQHLTFWRLMPLITAILGALTFILGILPVCGVNSPVVKILFIVCGVATFVCGLLVMIFTSGTAILEKDYRPSGFHPDKMIGAYYALIGGIIAACGAICSLLIKKKA